jgi:TPR repeat protein
MQSEATAMNNLGTMYEKGLGTEMNLDMALYWYKKAAHAGDATAKLNLANMYEQGNGFTNNELKKHAHLKEAVKLFRYVIFYCLSM